MRSLLGGVGRGAILYQGACRGAACLLPCLLAPLLVALAACASESRGASDPLSKDLRRRVDALRAEVASVPTSATNIADRADVLWGWGNALATAGKRIPDSLPAEVAMAVIYLAEEGKPTGGSEMPFEELCASFDRYVRELELVESVPEAFGSFLLASAPALPARSWTTIELEYTVGSLGMKEGGGFLIGAQGQIDAGGAQNDDPDGDGYITIETAGAAARFVAASRPLTGLHGGNRAARKSAAFRLEGADLAPGATVRFHVGDTRQGSRGLQVQTSATDAFLVPIYVDVEGKGQFFAGDWPVLSVDGLGLERLTVFAPSVVAPGETFDLTVRAEDRHLNRASSPIPAWEVVRDGEVVKRLAAGGAALQIVSGLDVAEPGVHRFVVRTADGNLSAISNPVWVRPQPPTRVLWGETHGHTGLAEGQGSAEWYFRYGIEDARLDFLTLSEHDMWMDDAEWKLLDQLTRRTTAEGRTISFLGYEWTTTRDLGGHHNVFFRGPGRRRVPVQKAPSLEQLYAGLRAAEREADVLVIPHAHVAGDWRKNDAGIERLVEIASNHGTFEWFGQKYLANGFKVGFIAGADDHRSRPGRTGGRPDTTQLGGLAAALVTAKTPDAIFDALRARATYATSGERIVLEVAANGQPPGSELPAGALELRCRVMGTAPIDQIDVIRNGEVAFTRSYLTAPLQSRVWVQVSFESSSAVFGSGLDNPRGYRPWKGTLKVDGARVLQVRTPGFVNEYRSRAEIDGEDPTLVRFQTETRGRRDVMLVELDGASSSTRFHFALEAGRERRAAPVLVRPLTDIPATAVTLAFDRMAGGRLEHAVPVDAHSDRILLQTVDPDAPLDREFEWRSAGALAAGDYVYVRVTQLDGGRAWSSPVFMVDAR
jgi:hypothetical protein